MALHPDFPASPYAELLPDQRWFPAAEELRATAYEKLLPPLVAKILEEIKAWRDTSYKGASKTSRALLTWWFDTEHLIEQADGTLTPFRYYFAQREAVETVIWLHDVREVKDKFDLLRFDASGSVSTGLFDEDWPRYVLKMATGAGKTKVLSLLIAWSYFHKIYEPDSRLARNFLLIAPNIIVLDRLRADFDGLRIFFNDPVLPDLGEIVREIEELAVFNDEAHHIHDPRMAWFKSIQDIHHRMLQKDCRLTLQVEVDVTATPRHNSGAIFVQTVCDYPLVEAIHQNVVKHPVLPDIASRARLNEVKSAIFTEKYADYLQLGIEEWRKSYADHEKLGKKAVLFVMVDDTRNCDEVGAYLKKICPKLQDAVLVIHTKNNGEISEAATGKNKEELEVLRKASNDIDGWNSPYKAIVSVLMLKEGWDVRNVTTIVGLRAYVAVSNILPEQTLGRGLRRMYFGSDIAETVSVMGTPAFMEFVESIQSEGVSFERVPMGGGATRQDSLVVEVETGNPDKDVEALDIALPRLTRRFNRDFKELDALDPAAFGNKRLPLKTFTPEETREIVFNTMLDGEQHHTILLDTSGIADYRSVVGFFARQLLKELRLVGGYDVLYGKVKTFLREHLFEGSSINSPVNLEDPQVLRNLSEPAAGKILFDSFKAAINALTVQDKGSTHIQDRIRLRDTRPFRTEQRPYIPARKSLFNKIVGEPNAGGLELAFAKFLDDAPDVAAFAKNYLAVGFKVEYVKANGDLSNYIPDFIVKTTDGTVWIVETKGRAELDLPQKMKRLAQWCADATAASAAEDGPAYRFVYVDQEGFERNPPNTFAALMSSFTDYQENAR